MSDSHLVVDSPTSWSLRGGAALMFVTLLAALCWSAGLQDGYWIDEVISRDTASEGWTALLGRAGFGDVHPPLYYALLKLWSGLAGASDVMGRSLSLVLGLGATTLMFLQGWRRGGLLPATLASSLLAVCPLTVHYAVEVRSYALLLLLSVGSSLAVDRWVERPLCARRGLIWAVLCSLLVLTHYFGWIWALLLAAYGGLAVSRSWDKMGRWLLVQLTVLSAAGLWLPLVLVQARHLPPEVTAHLSSSLPTLELLALFGPGAGHPLALLSVGAGCLTLGLAAWGGRLALADPVVEPGEEQGSPPAPMLFGVAVLTVFIAPLVSFALMPMSELLMDLFLEELPGAYGLMALAALGALGLSRLGHRLPRLSPGALEVSLLVGGGAILGVLSLTRPILTPRNLILFLPPLLVLVSVALARQARVQRWVCAGLLMGAAVLTLPGNQDRFQPRPDLRGAAQRLESAAGPSVVWPRWDAPGIAHYASSPPTGILGAEELPPPRGDSFDVVLTRQGAAEPERFVSAVSSHLGPAFKRTDRWDGRGVSWIRWRRAVPSP